MTEESVNAARDVRLININDPSQVAAWAAELGVSGTELRQAVIATGPTVHDVKRYLGM